MPDPNTHNGPVLRSAKELVRVYFQQAVPQFLTNKKRFGKGMVLWFRSRCPPKPHMLKGRDFLRGFGHGVYS